MVDSVVPGHLLELPKGKKVPKGLHVYENILQGDEASRVMSWVQDEVDRAMSSGQSNGWEAEEYGACKVFRSGYSAACGGLFRDVARRIEALNVFDEPLNYLQINYYRPGMGIHAHEDPNHLSNVSTVSCGDARVMEFYPYNNHPTLPADQVQARLKLVEGNVVILQDDSRSLLRHGVLDGQNIPFKREKVPCSRARVSLNFAHNSRSGR